MTGIEITSKDAERIAKSFNDLIKPAGLNRMRRKAVNKVGADVRKKTRSILPVVIGTSAAALQVQGKAAAPGSTNPAYRLRFANRIPVAKMKASHRKVTRRRGKKSLALTLPGGKKIGFRSIHREGATFTLLRAGPLRARRLGGVYTNPKTAFERYPALKSLRRDAERELPELMAAAIREHLAKRRGR